MVDFKKYVEDYPNFPKEGILFRDINPLLRNYFSEVLLHMEKLFSEKEWNKVDSIAAIEARGFTLAAGLAGKLNKNIIQIRKAGKLPGKTEKISYGLEYGNDELEMHHGEENIIIIDDLLATGGTMKAAADLALKTGHKVSGIGVFINLKDLNNFKWNAILPRSVINYGE